MRSVCGSRYNSSTDVNLWPKADSITIIWGAIPCIKNLSLPSRFDYFDKLTATLFLTMGTHSTVQRKLKPWISGTEYGNEMLKTRYKLSTKGKYVKKCVFTPLNSSSSVNLHPNIASCHTTMKTRVNYSITQSNFTSQTCCRVLKNKIFPIVTFLLSITLNSVRHKTTFCLVLQLVENRGLLLCND